MIPFAAYTAAEAPNAFHWVKQPPKFACSSAGFDPHLRRGSLSLYPSQSSKLCLNQLSIFAGLTLLLKSKK